MKALTRLAYRGRACFVKSIGDEIERDAVHACVPFHLESHHLTLIPAPTFTDHPSHRRPDTVRAGFHSASWGSSFRLHRVRASRPAWQPDFTPSCSLRFDLRDGNTAQADHLLGWGADTPGPVGRRRGFTEGAPTINGSAGIRRKLPRAHAQRRPVLGSQLRKGGRSEWSAIRTADKPILKPSSDCPQT